MKIGPCPQCPDSDGWPPERRPSRWARRRRMRCKKRPHSSRTSALLAPCTRCCAQRAHGAIADNPVLAQAHMTTKRATVFAAEEDQNDACEDEMNGLFEFLT